MDLTENKEQDKEAQTKEKPDPTSEGRASEVTLDFAEMLERYSCDAGHFTIGALCKGRVVAIRSRDALVDIGYKSEGVVPLEEFQDLSGQVTIKKGDEINVIIEVLADAETGASIRLSHRKAYQAKVWEEIEEAWKQGKTVRGRIVENIRGGFLVDLGVRGFLPGSLVDIKKAADMSEYIGQEVELKIIKVSRRRDNVVVSRRAVLQEEEERMHRELFERLEIGKIVKGTIKNLIDYGAFVDLGGVDGLLHISDMAWKHVVHPSELFTQGQDVEVMVLNLDKNTGKISLGYKQKTRDPWETVDEKYPKGSRVQGKVVSLKDFGAFVELENGIEGLIHISEMSWTKRIRHPNQLLKQGDKVEVQILDYNPEKRRLSLGLRQLEPNPWQEFEGKHQIGERVKGRVKSLVEFGAFVELEEGVDGLIHVSDISWTENVRHPSQVLKKGQEVEAVILGMDVANGRISMGLKQLEPNAWDKFFESHKAGGMVTGRVTRLAEFGAFVELTEGVEGLVHISELADYHINKPSEVVREGDEIEVRILRMSREERKIGLSYKKLDAAPPEAKKERRKEKRKKKEEMPEEAEAAAEGRFRLGDMLGKALGRFKRGS